MVFSYLKRYGLVVCVGVYTTALVVLHVLGRFPVPSHYDVSRLIGSPALNFQGKVINFPQTRWGQTRFLMEGRVSPLEAFQGRALVELKFPIEDLAPGETLRVRGWLTALHGAHAGNSFDERAYWAEFGAFSILHAWSPGALERIQGYDHTAWRQRAWLFHQKFKQFWFDHLPYEEAALLSCITMGSRGILPTYIKNQCIRAGVYHILVVSGQKMALLIALAVGFLRFVGVPRRWAFWVCCLPIIFYATAVGADPPVLRAALMAVVALGVMAFGRDIPTVYPFVLAWLWILWREPEVLFGASFQLSFGATASLLALLPLFRRLQSIRSRFLRWSAEAGAVSLAVHLGVWPLLAYYFHQISLVGFIANWTLFPLSGAIMVAGLVLGTWGVCSPASVPACLIDGMHAVLKETLIVIEKMSGFKWAAIYLTAPSWIACTVYYVLLICILFITQNHAKK